MRRKYEWGNFRRLVRQYTDDVANLTYDGLTVTEWKPSPADIDDSDRYLLPVRMVWETLDKLLEPMPLPTFPKLPTSPVESSSERSAGLAEQEALRKMIEAKRRAFRGVPWASR